MLFLGRMLGDLLLSGIARLPIVPRKGLRSERQ